MIRPRIRVKHGNEKLTSHSGIVHVGTLLEASQLKGRLDTLDIHCENPKYSNSDIAFAMMGLISIGKPDYDAIELFREKPRFFVDALGISGCPSSPTLRQRMDLIADKANDVLKEESAALVRAKAPAVSALETSAGRFVPLDIDVSPFDNSKTSKEGVSRTYKGCDGYAPIFAYLGTEGYLVNLELRTGSQHCQKDTPQFLESTLDYVRQITHQPVLMRLDSGNDSQDNFPGPEHPDVYFIIKRNLRRESCWAWAALAKEVGQEKSCRDGKRVWIGSTSVGINGQELPYPIVFEVSERTIKRGQLLVVPEIEVDTYWYNLEQLEPEEVIELYHDHGTSEQYHSELKSDLDLERLPSQCFSTNHLMLHLGMLVYNILRIIGQHSLEEIDAIVQLPKPRQKKVKRRRIRTVMHDLIYMAGRLIHTKRQWFISFGQMNPFAELWECIDKRLRMVPDSG
jgi:hypothetical protein